MDATQQLTDISPLSHEPLALESEGLSELCSITHASEECLYQVLLEADVRRVSLEGLNHYRITVSSEHKSSGHQEKLRANLEINLRLEMNGVSIEGSSPNYFTITKKSLDMDDVEIDSSIHDVVDLGLMDQRVKSGIRPNSPERHESILFDPIASNLIKASISALLGISTSCHVQVIQNAGHLFASRQDYVRDMCTCMATSVETISASVTDKALGMDQGLF